MAYSPKTEFHVVVCNDYDNFAKIYSNVDKNNNYDLSFYVIAKTSNTNIITEFENIVRSNKNYIIYSNAVWYYLTILNKMTPDRFSRIFKHYYYPAINFNSNTSYQNNLKSSSNKRSSDESYSPSKKIKYTSSASSSSSSVSSNNSNKISETRISKIDNDKKMSESSRAPTPRYFEKSNDEYAQMFIDTYNGKLLTVIDDQHDYVFNKSSTLVVPKKILNIDTNFEENEMIIGKSTITNTDKDNNFTEEGEIIETPKESQEKDTLNIVIGNDNDKESIEKSKSTHEKLNKDTINQILQTKQNKSSQKTPSNINKSDNYNIIFKNGSVALTDNIKQKYNFETKNLELFVKDTYVGVIKDDKLIFNIKNVPEINFKMCSK